MKKIGLSGLMLCAALLAATPSPAVIQANLENPADVQAVSGITVISGWAFSTLPGTAVTLKLRIDGVTQDAPIPCCSSRRDVVDAHGADTPLESGFGLLFNYGLLSVGPHTIGVELDAPGETAVFIDHSVTVIKPGDAEFLTDFALPATATCAIEGNEIVITGAQVTPSGGTPATADLQAQFQTNSQSLGFTEVATYYVATTGGDANPGTRELPFQTLGKGVSVLQPGDTLYVRAGTYAEALYCAPGVCIPSGTSWAAPVTLAAYPGDAVTLQPASGLRVLNFDQTQAYIIVRGFIIDASNVGYDAIQIQGAAHHIRIEQCVIKNSPGNGVNLGPDAHYNEILNNTIHDMRTLSTSPYYSHGIYVASSNNLIAGNTISWCSGYGVHIYNSYPGKSADNNLVRDNEVYLNGTLTPSNAAGILLSSGSNNVADNNLVSGNPVGIRVYGNSSQAVVVNNTLHRNGVSILDEGTGTTLTENLAD